MRHSGRMVFADPRRCLSCRESIEVGTATCPHCGTDLNSPAIQQAWRALVVADQWIAQAKEPTPAPAPAALAPAPATEKPPHKLSAGTILLVLGAISLLVAGGIFVTVSWGSMGILGRALSLLAVTALVGTLAAVVTRRQLRASAEALWAVFLGLLSLDWFAAVGEGLFGLDALAAGYTVGIWGAVVAAASTAIVASGRKHLHLELKGPSVAAGAAAGCGIGWIVAEWTDDFWWAALAAVMTGAVAALLSRLRVTWGSRIAGAFAGFFALFAVLSALFEALDHPSLTELTVSHHGLPLVVVASAATAAGRLWNRVRSGAATLGTLAASALAIIPTEAAWHDHGAYVVTALLVGTLGFAVYGDGPWRRGVRWAMAGGTAALALAATPWVWRYLEVFHSGVVRPRSWSVMAGLDDPGDWSTSWWLPLVVAAGLAAAVLAMGRWPEGRTVTRHLRAGAWTIAAVGALAALTSSSLLPPALVVAGVTAAVGASLALPTRQAPDGWRHAGPAVVAAAPLVTVSSWPASLLIWPSTAAILLALTRLWPDSWLRRGTIAAACGWAVWSAGVAMRLIDSATLWTSTVVVAASVVALAIGVIGAKREWTMRSVEAAGAVTGGYGLLLGSFQPDREWLPWTVAGAGLAFLGIVTRRRRVYIPVGSALLGVAYVVRLADAGVDVIEAYTAPFAAVLLAAGWWAMRKSPSLSSVRALAAGTTLALLPSLPQAVDEPTSVRALLLGVTAAALLSIGARKRWKVPFIGGAVILLVIIVANIGPWALAVPRWILIGGVGTLAIAVGATWERRARDGRAAVRYINVMR